MLALRLVPLTSSNELIMDYITIFWIIVGSFLFPVEVVAYIVSIHRIIVDCQRIRRRSAAIRIVRAQGALQKQAADNESAPNVEKSAANIGDDKTSTIIQEPEQQVSTNAKVHNVSNNAGSLSTVADTTHVINGKVSVKAAMEYNPRMLNGGVLQDVFTHSPDSGKYGRKRGVDNLGSSFSDIGDDNHCVPSMKMDNLRGDLYKNDLITMASGSRARHSHTEVHTDTISLEAHQETSCDNIASNASTLLPASQRRTRLQRGNKKPKRGKTCSYPENEPVGDPNPGSAEGSLTDLNNTEKLVFTQSQRGDANPVSLRYNRRYSYAAAVDTGLGQEKASPIRSFSNDDLQRLSSSYEKEPIRVLKISKGIVNESFLTNGEASFEEI